MNWKRFFVVYLVLPLALWSQSANDIPPEPAAAPPTASPTPAKPPVPLDAIQEQSKFLGKDLPFFNPGSDIISWDGKNWNIVDNRLFRARFEKYLNAAEQTSKDDQEYQRLLQTILSKLAPDQVSSVSVDEAWGLLSQASNYDSDAKLCDSLAEAVYAVWLAKKEIKRLTKALESWEKQKESIEWNLRMSAENPELQSAPPRNPEAAAEWVKEKELKRQLRTQPHTVRLADVNAMITANRVKREASELQAKIEFQTLIFQFFLQRRFQHVVIANRFYRAVFGDGDTQLRLDEGMKQVLTRGSGLPATVGLLDSLANEAMRDVREGVDAYKFLLEKNELSSASQRLAETFALGEYMPEIRTLPREEKRRALDFAQKSNQLLSALEVKDYARAEELVKDLEVIAKDFDRSKPLAAIETAKTVSRMHLSKARNAAVSGDRVTLENEIRAATEIWPRNPELAEASKAIFSQTDIQQQALVDFDRLKSQKNYRQIFEDRVRFIAATALYPERQDDLRDIIQNVQTIDLAIARADEIAKRGDYAGAWESVEKAFQQFPEDNKLNQTRADYTTQAAEFVRSLRQAQALRNENQLGSSLAWYLKAQKIYPPSEFAKEGIQELVKQMFPEIE